MDEPSKDVQREVEEAARNDDEEDTDVPEDESAEDPPEGMPSDVDRIVTPFADDLTGTEHEGGPGQGTEGPYRR